MSLEYVLHHRYEWLNVTLLHKYCLFCHWHSQHSSTNLLHFWICKLPIHPCYKDCNCMDVFQRKIKQICSNCFVFRVLEWVLVVLDLGFTQDASNGSDIDAAAASVPCLSASLSFFSLLINECLPKTRQQFPLWYYLQKAVFLSPISSWICIYLWYLWSISRTTLLLILARFVKVFHLCVKRDASLAQMSLLQIKHFPTLWFTDRNGFLSSSTYI